MRKAKHSETTLFKTPVGTAITVVTGLIVSAVSFLMFVLDLLVTPEIGALILSFVLCGIGLTTGFFLLYRAVPRREPTSLFAGSGGVPVPPTAQAETRTQVEQNFRNGAEITITMPRAEKGEPISNSNRHRSIASYKARDSSGAVGFAIIIGCCLILGGRLRGGWEFLSFVVPAGCLVALALYWIRQRQNQGLSGYNVPVAGGFIGLAAMIALSVIMMRFHFLRDFLGLAVGAGGVIALVLDWGRRRRQNSSGPFV